MYFATPTAAAGGRGGGSDDQLYKTGIVRTKSCRREAGSHLAVCDWGRDCLHGSESDLIRSVKRRSRDRCSRYFEIRCGKKNLGRTKYYVRRLIFLVRSCIVNDATSHSNSYSHAASHLDRLPSCLGDFSRLFSCLSVFICQKTVV